MYEWRNMSSRDRQEALESRKAKGHPWHGPPHFESECGVYHIAAACYEHKPVIGNSAARMTEFESALLSTISLAYGRAFAWCVLPTHYHVLLECEDLKMLLKLLGQLHGRTSFTWNGEEGVRGRKVWHRCSDRIIRSERHFWASVNYIHNNPVRHRYVTRWQDWPYSSALGFLQEVGRHKAKEIWEAYPVRDFGKGWDDP